MSRSIIKFFLFACLIPQIAWGEWGKQLSHDELSKFSSVSLGFAAQDLKSPISNFGHTFLIFHNEELEADSIVLEFTGKAPTLTDNIAALVHTVPGHYSLTYFADKRREYDLENRSLWIYNLNLNSDEVLRLKKFVHEAIGVEYPYDFSQRNCAWYISYALEQAQKVKYEKEGVFVTPLSVIKWASNSGLILSSTFEPSTQLRALELYKTLNEHDQHIVQDYFAYSPRLSESDAADQVGHSISLIAEYRLPREADASLRGTYFNIKQHFRSAAEAAYKVPDPLFSNPSGLLSFQSVGSGGIFTVSPGFIRLENEQMFGVSNASVEALRTSIYASNEIVRLDEFNLVTLEANQPTSYLVDGFTQMLSISYKDYQRLIGEKYTEEHLMFGRGASIELFGVSLSAEPVVSLKDIQTSNGSYAQASVIGRGKMYCDIKFAVISAQLMQAVRNDSVIQQEGSFNMSHTFGKYSLGLAFRLVSGHMFYKSESGIKLSVAF